MENKIEKLLLSPYWIIDILPGQVPKDSPGQYFAVEKYLREGEQMAAIKQKHINIILKLNCYREIFLDEETTGNPQPERIAEEMRKRYLYIMVDEAMIQSEPDATYLTVYNPDKNLLDLLTVLASGEGLYVWSSGQGLGIRN